MNRTEALQATRNGAIAACISAVITLGIVLLAMSSDASESLQFWSDPAMLLDVVIIFSLAYGISRQSRAAAVAMVVYFVVSKIVIAIELGRFPGIVMAIVFFYFYVKAVQGAFVFHRLEKAENPNYRPVARWVPWVTAPLGILFAVVLVGGLLSVAGMTPPSAVQAGHEVSQKHRAELVGAGIIERDEPIDHFYGLGLTSILEGGVLLTSDRVVLYYPEYGEVQAFDMYFDEIANVALVEPGGYFSEAIYLVLGHDEDSLLQLPLATDKRGDVRFIDAAS